MAFTMGVAPCVCVCWWLGVIFAPKVTGWPVGYAKGVPKLSSNVFCQFAQKVSSDYLPLVNWKVSIANGARFR